MLARPTTLTPKDPYQLQIAATDTLGPDDVVVALVEGDPRCAFWGELFSTAAIGRGATGALIDGGVRDVVGIERLGFSVFARDSQPGDSLGRLDVVAYDVEVLVRGVRVMPGDLVFADRDGIVIVPGDAIGDVLERAFAKRSVETTVQKELLGGASLRDVFDRHKVL
jgi:regulator of RNase E activity RraA